MAKKVGTSRVKVEKASKSMGKGQSGIMKTPGGKGNKSYCPKIEKIG